jgi:uracil-DNA glycosylase family protein
VTSIKHPGAAQFVPHGASLTELKAAIQSCRGCDLYRNATQAVFGAGPISAKLFFIGEQPGDSEDRQGEPFVGPAGKVLERALEQAGLDRLETYVTNAVKHFKFEQRGKRRIHKKPTDAEISACYPWLQAEIEKVRPVVAICLGATAARAMLGRAFRLMQHRGEFFEHPLAAWVTATIHPSVILRIPDATQRHAEFAALVRDLSGIHEKLAQK